MSVRKACMSPSWERERKEIFGQILCMIQSSRCGRVWAQGLSPCRGTVPGTALQWYRLEETGSYITVKIWNIRTPGKFCFVFILKFVPYGFSYDIQYCVDGMANSVDPLQDTVCPAGPALSVRSVVSLQCRPPTGHCLPSGASPVYQKCGIITV